MKSFKLIGVILLVVCLGSIISNAYSDDGYRIPQGKKAPFPRPLDSEPASTDTVKYLKVNKIESMRMALLSNTLIFVKKDGSEIYYLGKDFSESYGILDMLRNDAGSCPEVILTFETPITPYGPSQTYFRDLKTMCYHENTLTTCSCVANWNQ